MNLQYVHNNQIRIHLYLALLPYMLTRPLGEPTKNAPHSLGMKTLTAKQEVRLQKKKKKMAALAEIVKLNDKDRQSKKNRSSNSSSNEDSDSTDKTDCRKICAEEPKSKRIKINCHTDENEMTAKKSKKSSGQHAKTQTDKVDGQNQKKPTTVDDEIRPDNIQLTEEQYAQLKRDLNERKRGLRNVPKLRLKQQGEQASLSQDIEGRTPIFLTDIQHLLMLALIGNESPCTPQRWCHVEKSSRLSHTLVLVVEGLSLFHFLSYESNFTETNRVFQHKLEACMPPHRDGKIVEELTAVPLTNSEKEELIKQYGSLEAAVESKKDPMLLVKTIFPVDQPDESPVDESIPSCDQFPRTQLILSALQMVDEGYPLPLRGDLASRFSKYEFTKERYAPVTPNSPMFGLDCEMCRTSKGCSELTRIAIVDEDIKPVYETLVRPTNKITDYLTPFSGITPEMLIDVTKSLQEVQEDIRRLLPADAILVGQSLNIDLQAMRMMHPYVIDTSVIFNVTGERRIKAKLAALSKRFLGEDIQQDVAGHDPLEDSSASMKLTKLKLSKSLDFGDAVLERKRKANAVSAQKITAQATEVVSHNLFAHLAKVQRRTAIVTSDEMNVDFHKVFNNKANVYVGDDTVQNGDQDKAPGESQHCAIDCFRIAGNKAAIRKTRDICANYALTITNMNVAPQRLELSRIEKTIANVDKWISRLWETVSANGLFVVLFGGAPGASSGVALVKIKNGVANPSTDTPPLAV